MAKLIALLTIFDVMKSAHSFTSEGDVGGKSGPACLLQSTFASSDLSVDAAGDVHAADQGSLAITSKTVTFESDAMDETSTQGLMLRSRTRSRSCKAHLGYLNRKVHGLEHAHNVSNKKIDELVQGFISKQSGSQDACSSQLMEAKHQLNQIHQYVLDLVVQVNHTELAVVALDAEMEDQIKEMEKLDKWREDELAICEKKKQEYIEMYTKLSAEMEEMKQIASPGVAMDIKTGKVLTAETVGFLQMQNHSKGVKGMMELQLLIKGTQSAAKRYMTCMADHSRSKEQGSPGKNKKGKGKKGKGKKGKPMEGPAEAKYNCKTKEAWGDKKKKWCCKNEGICQTGGSDPEVNPPEFNCRTREAWGAAKKKWCCKNEGICRTMESESVTIPPPEKHIDPYGFKPAESESVTIPPPEKHIDDFPKFNCKTKEAWGAAKKKWCCKNEGICKTGGPDPEPEPIKPIESESIKVTAPPTETHIDPYGFKPTESESITRPPPEKHVDPPDVVPFEPESVKVTAPPTETHIDPYGFKPAESESVTKPPPEKHVDPPNFAPAQSETVTERPPEKTIDPPMDDEPIEPPNDEFEGEEGEGQDYYHTGDLGDDDGSEGGGGDFRRSSAEGENFEGATMNVDSLRDENDQAAMDAAAAIKSGAASPEECKKEKKNLEETYVKTYVELSRLKDEYNELANSTACEDNVESLHNSKKTPIQEKIDGLIKDIDEKVRELQNLRPRLESATEAETELRKHIGTLTEECTQLPETVSNLDKVRDAIEALSKCPGLSRVQFSLPKWIGTWVSFDFSAKDITDEEQDKVMNAACAEAAKGTRAAEVGEIAEQTVEGIPEANTADLPVIGTCPHCQGDEATDFPSGHKRICWKQGNEFSSKAKSTNCAVGKKALLCVSDRENIRQIPGQS